MKQFMDKDFFTVYRFSEKALSHLCRKHAYRRLPLPYQPSGNL